MNAKQRRTVRRAKDARRPWGRAVERERRKAKRERGRETQLTNTFGPERVGWNQDALIEKVRKAFNDGAGALWNPNHYRCRELYSSPDTSDRARETGCFFLRDGAASARRTRADDATRLLTRRRRGARHREGEGAWWGVRADHARAASSSRIPRRGGADPVKENHMLAICISASRNLIAIFLLDLASIAFIAMKAAGVMHWSWWWILLPLALSCLNGWTLTQTAKILIGESE